MILAGWGISITGGVFLALHPKIVDPTCLYFRLTEKKAEGWELTVGLVLVFNFLMYSTIGHLHGYSIRVMNRNRQAVERRITSNEISIITRQTIITVNCFLSWLVIASVCLHTVLSEDIDSRINAWILTLVLPFNAYCNPILYTLATITFRDQLISFCTKLSNKLHLMRNLKMAQGNNSDIPSMATTKSTKPTIPVSIAAMSTLLTTIPKTSPLTASEIKMAKAVTTMTTTSKLH